MVARAKLSEIEVDLHPGQVTSLLLVHIETQATFYSHTNKQCRLHQLPNIFGRWEEARITEVNAQIQCERVGS